MSPQCLPLMFGLNLTNRSRASGFEDFQAGHRGGHLGYQNRTILAILNLCIAPMPLTTYPLNPTYGLGGDVVWRFSRRPIWWLSWILEQIDFSNSISPCIPNASHQVGAQSDCSGADVVSRFSRWPPWRPAWIAEQNDFSNSESLCHCSASHLVSVQSDLLFGRRCRLKNFKMVTMAAILDIGTEQF